jgi:CRP-like cAMP-binding protein
MKMNEALDQFKRTLIPYGITEASFDVLIQYCNVVNFKKGQIIIQAEKKQNYIYFINQGIIRNYVVSSDGKIKTYGFRAENMLVTGYGLHNYNDEYKSLVNVECIEDCEMIIISYTGLHFLEKSFKEGHIIARFLAETHAIELVKFRISLDTKSLMERYEELGQLFPNIYNRVSQNIVASYLGVTSVHLSRVKNNR